MMDVNHRKTPMIFVCVMQVPDLALIVETSLQRGMHSKDGYLVHALQPQDLSIGLLPGPRLFILESWLISMTSHLGHLFFPPPGVFYVPCSYV